MTPSELWGNLKRTAGLGGERGGKDVVTRVEAADAVRRGLLSRDVVRQLFGSQQQRPHRVFSYSADEVDFGLHGDVDRDVAAVRLEDVADELGVERSSRESSSSGSSSSGSSSSSSKWYETNPNWRGSSVGPIPSGWELVDDTPSGVWDAAFRTPSGAKKLVDVDRPNRLIRDASDAPQSTGSVTLPGEDESTTVESGESVDEAKRSESSSRTNSTKKKAALAAAAAGALLLAGRSV